MTKQVTNIARCTECGSRGALGSECEDCGQERLYQGLGELGPIVAPKAPPLRRVQRIRSHSGLSRFLATVEDTDAVIPRQHDILSPYRYAETHDVYQHPTYGAVVWIETAHKVYDVFTVAPEYLTTQGDK